MTDNIIDSNTQIDIDLIVPAESNPYVMPDSVFESLKDNIKQNGFIGSILVRKHPLKRGKYEIIDGEHRWRACKELNYSKMSVIVLDYNDINSAIQLIRFNREKGYFDPNKLKTIVDDLIKKTNKALVKDKLHVSNPEFNEMFEQHMEKATKEIKEELQEQINEYTDLFEANAKKEDDFLKKMSEMQQNNPTDLFAKAKEKDNYANIELDKIKLSDIEQADYNPRYMSESERDSLNKSLESFGVVDPIIINLKNNRIIGGHQRYISLTSGNIDGIDTEDMNIIKLGDIGWVFPNKDIKIENEEYEKALNIALNKISGEWEYGQLNDLLSDLQLKDIDISITGFDDLEGSILDMNKQLEDISEIEIEEDDYETIEEIKERKNKENEDKYTMAVDTVSYEPQSEEKPELSALYDTDKYKQLLLKIDNANVSDEEREFLVASATRFIKFDFSKIAEYYCHSDKEMQDIIEELALVIIDFDSAIQKGLVNMSKRVSEVIYDSL